MIEAFKQHLTHLGLTELDTVIVAVSGGVDSMVLLECLRYSVDRKRLVVAHFDHNVRVAESRRDRNFVARYCKSLGVEFVSQRRRGEKSDSEASLRHSRRCFLESVRKQRHGVWIATGHHLDDNFETFLMRLIRGSGLKGLASMRAKNGVWIKPLLQFSRREIEAFALERGLVFQVDSTNETDRYFRNRVRKTLVPQIGRLSEPFGGERELLRRFKSVSEDLRWAADRLEADTQKLYSQAVFECEYFVRMDISVMSEASPITRHRVYQQALAGLTDREITREDLERLDAAIVRRRRSICAPGKVSVCCSLGFAYFEGPPHQEAFRRLAKWLPRGVRLPCPGDRLAGSSQKLFDWFLIHRVPRVERRTAPVSVDTRGRVDCVFSPLYYRPNSRSRRDLKPLGSFRALTNYPPA